MVCNNASIHNTYFNFYLSQDGTLKLRSKQRKENDMKTIEVSEKRLKDLAHALTFVSCDWCPIGIETGFCPVKIYTPKKCENAILKWVKGG
jgi:septum formation inhibitor-activating ATPase MinD